MKIFKTGFLAVIALAAMSFTIAAHENFFKKSKLLISNCYDQISYKNTPCSSSAIVINNSRLCSENDVTSAIGKPVFAVGSISTDPLCGSGSTFCCATLERGSKQCTTQQQLEVTLSDGTTTTDYVQVLNYYCKN